MIKSQKKKQLGNPDSHSPSDREKVEERNTNMTSGSDAAVVAGKKRKRKKTDVINEETQFKKKKFDGPVGQSDKKFHKNKKQKFSRDNKNQSSKTNDRTKGFKEGQVKKKKKIKKETWQNFNIAVSCHKSKIGFDMSCKLYPKETMCMKYQTIFWKK